MNREQKINLIKATMAGMPYKYALKYRGMPLVVFKDKGGNKLYHDGEQVPDQVIKAYEQLKPSGMPALLLCESASHEISAQELSIF